MSAERGFDAEQVRVAHSVELRPQPARQLAVVRFRAGLTEVGAKIGPAFAAVHQFLVEKGIRVQGPAVAVYKKRDDGFDVAAGFEVASPITAVGPVEPAELPACDAAVTTHLGGYAELPNVYAEILSWIEAEGREPTEMMWEEYWSDPSTPPERTRTDVFWPVQRA